MTPPPDRPTLLDPYDLEDETEPARGTVAEQDRGALPFALLHGEALVACAAWALGEAGVRLVDSGTPWSAVVDAEEPYVLHDSLCPMAPPTHLAACVAEAVATGEVVVGVREVTDTVKRVEEGAIGATVDRDGVWAVVSPLVLPAAVVAGVGDETDGAGLVALSPGLDLAELVEALARWWTVRPVLAPASAVRVGSEDDLEVLAALTEPGSSQPGSSQPGP